MSLCPDCPNPHTCGYGAYCQHPYYVEVTVLYDGVVSEIGEFDTDAAALHYVGDIRDEATTHNVLTEVYVVRHEHAPGIECECAQYVQDHRPAFTFNGPEDQ